MKHFCVIANRDKDEKLKLTQTVVDYINNNGGECVVAAESRSTDCGFGTDAASIPDNVEGAIVLGGDGTILQAAYDLAKRKIPILGINLGTLGFLADTEANGIEASLKKLLADEFIYEERTMLSVNAAERNELALNDVVVTRSGFSRLIRLGIYVDNNFVNEYCGDGIIVSTPTGSTAYNLSAGGPVVVPKADLMIITPICPHSLYARSVIVPSESRITICVNASKKMQAEEVIATVDGSRLIPLTVGQSITIARAEQKTRLIKLNEHSFFHVLNSKLT